MKLIVRSACAVLVLALVPVGARSALVDYASPAANLPAGPSRGAAYSAVLPSGRLVTPAGTSIVTGMDTLGVVLTPDGRFAITSNDDEREAAVSSQLDPAASGGYSLTVVDTATMTAVAHYRASGEAYFSGLAAVKDPSDPGRTLVFAAGGSSHAVYTFDLDAGGGLQPDARHRIDGLDFPSMLLASGDGRRIYALDLAGDSVGVIDTAARALVGAPVPVGFTPCAAAVAGTRLLVTNEGLMRYGAPQPGAAAPSFAMPDADPADASSLSLLALDAGGLPAATRESVPMDPAPDGLRLVGGAHPSAIVTTADGAYAFVAMTNVDRIATVALNPTPRVAGGTELRLFDRGPYGTQPTALALSRDASRLYVALAGLDAVAVIDARDPLHLHRLGLIPTGWVPSALALSADDRTLFVANQNGFGHDAGDGGDPANGADAGAVWSTLQRIDLAQVRLAESTRAALAATRRVVALPVPLPKAIRNVVLIVENHQTYDEMLGDLGSGPGAPSYVRYDSGVTPNLHALARRFALAGNLFADSDADAVAEQIVAGGLATAFAERTAGVGAALRPLGFTGEDPDDASRLGTVFNQLARHNLSFRDYGAFLAAPAPAVLAGNVDLSYPVPDAKVPDSARAAEFVRDYGALIAAHRPPRFAYVALPGGAGNSVAAVADGDRALGTILDYLSHAPTWHTSAVFVLSADPGNGRDHVDASRTFAIVASPWVKRGYVGMHHLATASVLKTVDRIFSLPPLSLGDLLVSDMGDFFSTKPDRRPYEGAPPPADNDSGRGVKRSP